MNFIEVYFNGVLKHSIEFNADTITIGRDPKNLIVIDNMGVSGHHAVLTHKDNQYFLEDLNSTNGTFLNSEKITGKHQINSTDSIIIGKHTLRFAEWSHTSEKQQPSYFQAQEEATMLVEKGHRDDLAKQSNSEKVTAPYYLLIKGEANGIDKLLLTKPVTGIGKAKDNTIRIKGWLTPAKIAEIHKIGQSYYLIPLKRKLVKLNNRNIEDSTLLSPDDRINIDKLTIRFMKD